MTIDVDVESRTFLGMQHGYTLKTHIFHINYSLSLDLVYLRFDVDKLCYSMMLSIATKT